MLHIKSTIEYAEFKFTSEHEAIAASKYTEAQGLQLRNVILQCVNEKLSMVPDPTNPQDYFLKQEYLRGQIDILQYLLAMSEASSQTVVTLEEQE